MPGRTRAGGWKSPKGSLSTRAQPGPRAWCGSARTPSRSSRSPAPISPPPRRARATSPRRPAAAGPARPPPGSAASCASRASAPAPPSPRSLRPRWRACPLARSCAPHGRRRTRSRIAPAPSPRPPAPPPPRAWRRRRARGGARSPPPGRGTRPSRTTPRGCGGRTGTWCTRAVRCPRRPTRSRWAPAARLWGCRDPTPRLWQLGGRHR
mmetsp:Transcript_37619/g.118616  ORF Transcript_37619/g.118616 Transcript_37619/m.118616 type:complete len:209 (-) Transcript_37619:546-1172(-)